MNRSMVSYCKHLLVLLLGETNIYSTSPTDNGKQWFFLSQACSKQESLEGWVTGALGEGLPECKWYQNSFIMEKSHPRMDDPLLKVAWMESFLELTPSLLSSLAPPRNFCSWGRIMCRLETGWREGVILMLGEAHRPQLWVSAWSNHLALISRW